MGHGRITSGKERRPVGKKGENKDVNVDDRVKEDLGSAEGSRVTSKVKGLLTDTSLTAFIHVFMSYGGSEMMTYFRTALTSSLVHSSRTDSEN